VSALVLCAGAGAGDVGVVELGAVVACGGVMGVIICVWFSLCGAAKCQEGYFRTPSPTPLTKASSMGYNRKQQSGTSKSRKWGHAMITKAVIGIMQNLTLRSNLAGGANICLPSFLLALLPLLMQGLSRVSNPKASSSVPASASLGNVLLKRTAIARAHSL
jgi:hypothetical protein